MTEFEKSFSEDEMGRGSPISRKLAAICALHYRQTRVCGDISARAQRAVHMCRSKLHHAEKKTDATVILKQRHLLRTKAPLKSTEAKKLI